MPHQQIRHMPTHPPIIKPLHHKRLRSNRHDIPVLISQQDPRQLQPRLVHHMTARGRAEIPPRVMLATPIRAELAHRQTRKHLLTRQTIQHRVHEHTIGTSVAGRHSTR